MTPDEKLDLLLSKFEELLKALNEIVEEPEEEDFIDQ